MAPSTRKPARPPLTSGDPLGAHTMACMEIWGGSDAADEAISAPGVDARIVSIPYDDDQAGGDVHYVSTCAAGNIARFVVADVAGHGAAVSGVAATLRRLMRRNMNTLDQSRFIRSLNSEFGRLNTEGVFATALAATYFWPRRQLLVCNAGHPRPLWRRAADEQWSMLHPESAAASASSPDQNLPLGVIEPTDYRQFAIDLDVGDMVLIYSDSLIEARDQQRRLLGESGLIELVNGLDHNDPGRFIEDLLKELRQRSGDAPFDDDVTALLLHHTGEGPPRQTLADRVATLAKVIGLRPVGRR